MKDRLDFRYCTYKMADSDLEAVEVAKHEHLELPSLVELEVDSKVDDRKPHHHDEEVLAEDCTDKMAETYSAESCT